MNFSTSGMVAVERVPAARDVRVVLLVVGLEVVVDAVVEAAEADRRALVVALAGVVEDHVEDHLDAGLVEGLDHVPELVDVGALVGRDAVALVRGEEADRAVAPVVDESTYFAVFSQHATSVELLLFERHDSPKPIKTIQLDPGVNRTFYFWHIYVVGVTPGMGYAYRVDGPKDLHGAGHRFNPNKVLIDPYGRGTTSTLWDRAAACGPDDNLAHSLRSVVVDMTDYDWEGDQPLRRSMQETVIYEMHVRGFTKSPTSGATHPGTYRGVIEKIPYLQSLGVTAVELLPVFEFDETRSAGRTRSPASDSSTTGATARSASSPRTGLLRRARRGHAVHEFRDMVKALHRAGIEVILDVVFNHTAEGNHERPDDQLPRPRQPHLLHARARRKQYYMNFRGCGNTLNCNHPDRPRMIIATACATGSARCTSTASASTSRRSCRATEHGAPLARPADPLGDRAPTRCWPDTQAHRRGLGRRRPVSGRLRSPATAGPSGTASTATTCAASSRATPGIVSAMASRIARQPRPLPGPDGARPIRSINFITATTASRSTTWSPTTTSTTRPTARTTATARTTTIAGTAARKATRDDPGDRARCASRQIRNFLTILLRLPGRRR